MTEGDWDEVFEEAEAEYFVGREQELESFRQQIGLKKPRYLIFYIAGQGGVGKTTLLNRFQEIAEGNGFLLADCDEKQRDVSAVLGRFAQQLTDLGFSLKHFNENYKLYRQKMHEIESDSEAPQGLAATLARTVVRALLVGGDTVPGIRKGLEFVPREAFEIQASEWATYLAKKFTNKDEMALLRDPISILTPLFFENLNEIAQKRKVLLCFDNFEAASPELLEWLLGLREYKPSLNIRVAIAGRDQPGAKWDTLHTAMLTIRLDVFKELEAQMFLDSYGVTNSKRRQEILELSGRLPVLMSWLVAAGGQVQELDSSIPSHDIVDRFMRWVTDSVLKQVALLAAIPRNFNIDILKLLLKDRDQTVDEQSAFDWLQTMPFVKQGAEGWYYHDVVRRMMLHYQRQKSPQMYRQIHNDLAYYYDAYRRERSSSEGEQWRNEEWRKYTLAYVYHFLVVDPNKHWAEAMSLFIVAIRKRRSFAIEIIELLNLEDVYDELSQEQKVIVQLFSHQLRAIENGVLKDGFEMFDKLCTIPGLSPWAKCYAFAYRGENYRLDNKWEKALNDFDEALQCISEDPWASASRGQTYQAMKRYEEALADFNRAIALDGKMDWAIASRGQTYQAMEQYEEALADFNCLIALDEKDVWAIANRGQTYQAMKRYEEALADFNRLIALDEKDAWAIASRGETYWLMERYEEAVADFNHANALNGKWDLAIAHPGEDYRVMERYEEELPTYNRAIALDEKDARAGVRRGQTYQAMERYEEALAAYNRALLLMRKMPGQVPGVGKRIKL